MIFTIFSIDQSFLTQFLLLNIRIYKKKKKEKYIESEWNKIDQSINENIHIYIYISKNIISSILWKDEFKSNLYPLHPLVEETLTSGCEQAQVSSKQGLNSVDKEGDSHPLRVKSTLNLTAKR